MKTNAIKFKKILIFYIIFILSNFLSISNLKGAEKDEVSTYIPHSSRVVMAEDLLDSAAQQENQYADTPPIAMGPLLRYGTIGVGLDLQKPVDSETFPTLTNSISNRFLASFQDYLEEGISRGEVIKYIICFVGGVGPFIPQIAISQTIGRNYNSKLIEYTLIGASAVSIEAITSWMIWELIDDTKSLITATKKDEASPISRKYNVLKSVGIGLSSLVLGILSSAPDVYVKYQYNNIKWLTLISLVYDSIPRVIGFYKLFSSLQLDTIKRIYKEPEIDERHAIQVIDISTAYFLQKCKEEGVEGVSQSLSFFTTPKDAYSYITSNTHPNLGELDAPRDCAKGIPRKGIKGLSLLLPVASATFNIAMAYKGFKLLVDNDGALFLLSTFSVMPAFLLSSYVVMESAGNVFDKTYLLKSKTPSPDYFTNFHPRINMVLLGTSLMLASVTSFSSFNIIADSLAGTILDPVKYGIAALAVGTDFTFGTYAIYSTFKRYGEIIAKKFNKGTPYVINCTKKLSALGSSFANYSSSLLRRFVSDTTSDQDD